MAEAVELHVRQVAVRQISHAQDLAAGLELALLAQPLLLVIRVLSRRAVGDDQHVHRLAVLVGELCRWCRRDRAPRRPDAPRSPWSPWPASSRTLGRRRGAVPCLASMDAFPECYPEPQHRPVVALPALSAGPRNRLATLGGGRQGDRQGGERAAARPRRSFRTPVCPGRRAPGTARRAAALPPPSRSTDPQQSGDASVQIVRQQVTRRDGDQPEGDELHPDARPDIGGATQRPGQNALAGIGHQQPRREQKAGTAMRRNRRIGV